MRKGNLQKLKEIFTTFQLTVDVCNIFQRPIDSNGLIVVKLKRGLKYRGHVYFEPVRPAMQYISNTLIEDDILCLSLQFCQCTDNQDYSEIDDECRASFASLNNPLDFFKAVSTETTLVSEIANIVSENTTALAPGQGKTSVSIEMSQMSIVRIWHFHICFHQVNLVIK